MTAEELGQMIWNVKELLRNVYDNKDVEDVILPFDSPPPSGLRTCRFRGPCGN